MGIIVRILIAAVLAFVFIKLFKKAAGSLSVYKMNLTSLSFWYLVVFSLVGGTVVFLGFRDHYLIQKVQEKYIDKTYFIMMYALIMLPISMWFFNRLMGVKRYDRFYESYIKKDVVFEDGSSKSVFTIVMILAAIGTMALAYTFYCIGYVSLLELLKGNWTIMSQRQTISRGFTGNEYVRNILALGLIPYISYLSYIYYRKTKETRWKFLFIYLLIMSVACKTYDFEKASVVVYICYFYVIEVMLGRKVNFKKLSKFLIPAVAIILFFYYIVGDYAGKLFTFSSGPVSRLFITQIATLFLHIQLFPDGQVYLAGASFPKTLNWIFGTAEYGRRSGRVVMEAYNSAGVASGMAGVMNSLYIGEAYANFGIAGVIIAPIIVGFCMSVIPTFLLKQHKDPINMTLYIIVSCIYTTALVGGFVDYIYNILLVILFIVFFGIKAVANRGKIKIRRKSTHHGTYRL